MPSDRDVYVSRCLRVAAAAGAAGLKLRKLSTPALEVSGNGKSIAFPIVTDARTWRETTVEEAFYVVLVDARGWSSASSTLNDPAALASLDDTEKTEIPLVHKDLDDELQRVKSLADMLGGEDKLSALYATAELS